MRRGLVIATIAVVLLGVCSLVAAKNRSSGTAELIKDQYAAWNAHDPDKIVTFYTNDVVYEDVTFGIKANGHAELRKMAADFFASVPDLKLDIVKSTESDKGGSVEWVFSGTDTGLYKTGKKFSVRGVSVYELRGGKFASNRDYYDSASIMRQVGLLPQAGK